jgi:hypothetical protein
VTTTGSSSGLKNGIEDHFVAEVLQYPSRLDGQAVNLKCVRLQGLNSFCYINVENMKHNGYLMLGIISICF